MAIEKQMVVKTTDRTVNTEGEFTEVRLSDEDNQSSAILRNLTKAEFESLEKGAVYSIRFTKREAAPEPPMVTATLPAEDAGTLPNTAEIKKGKK